MRKLERNSEEVDKDEVWQGNHIAQMIDTACPGDPATDYALELQKILRDLDYETVIFALNIIPGVRPEDFRPIKSSEFTAPKEDDILLYHFTENSKVNPDYMKFKCHRILVWHGAVPEKFCASFDPPRAAASERMMREVSWLFPVTEAVIADSDASAQQIREIGYKGKIHVITPRVPFERFDPAESSQLPAADAGKTLLLAAGDILPERRIGELINSFAVYHRKYNPDSRLILLGRCAESSPYYLLLRDYEEKLALEPGAVFFAGKLSGRDTLPYFLHAALYLDMSAYEPFSISLIEALFLQLPALCTGNALTRQVLGENALFLPEDPILAAGLMDRVIRDEALKDEIIIKARDRLADFTAASQRETFVRVMQQMIEAGKVSMTKTKKKAGVE